MVLRPSKIFTLTCSLPRFLLDFHGFSLGPRWFMTSKAFPIFSLNLKFSLEPKALPRDSMGPQNFPKFYKVVYMFLLGLKSFHMFSLQPKTVCRRLKVF